MTVHTARTRGDATLAAIRHALAVVRRIIGAPDYELYARHMREHHPECAPLSAREFERDRLHDRYSRPGSRCC